jgi:hypothetical protein
MKNTQIILAKRPVGVPGPQHFALREGTCRIRRRGRS